MILTLQELGRRRPRHLPVRHLRGDDRADGARRLAARPAGAARPGRRPSGAARRLARAVRPEHLQRGGVRATAARHRLPGASACTSCAGRSRRRSRRRRPEQLALLRLDTDWYESTRHELEHLYPRCSPRRRADHRRLRPLGGRPAGRRRVLRRRARHRCCSTGSTTPAGSRSRPDRVRHRRCPVPSSAAQPPHDVAGVIPRAVARPRRLPAVPRHTARASRARRGSATAC